MSDNEIFVKAIRTYGVKAQVDMALEEMSELTKALLKYRRIEAYDDKTCGKARDVLENIQEEIVDVQIMLDQLKLMYGYNESVRSYKVDRLMQRLEESV